MKKTTIGVFDSGVGGLTVLRELMQRVPQADYLYFGDTARLPYGSKSVQTVAKYAIGAAQYLESHGAEYLVIACNTASALALAPIAQGCSIPVLGVIGPGADAAARASKSRKAVVIATEGTVNSHAYKRALEQHGIAAEEKACPLFVPLVEEGWTEHEVTERVAHIYLDALFENAFHPRQETPGISQHADTLVLGCTHYPLLKPLLRRVVPERVAIVDSAEATAAVVAETFAASPGHAPASPVHAPASPVHAPASPVHAPASHSQSATARFFATDSVEKFRRAGEKFLGRKIDGVEHVEIE
jgi:glutamate racemase